MFHFRRQKSSSSPKTSPTGNADPLTESNWDQQLETAAQPESSPAAQRLGALKRRIALNQLTTLRWSLERDLDEYASHDLGGIGVTWRKLATEGVRQAVRRIRGARLPVSSLGWIAGFTGQHGYTLRETMIDARRLIRVAGHLRASTVTVIAGPQAGHIRKHAMRLVADGLHELARIASLYDVKLALQPMHPTFSRQWSFLNSLDESLFLLDRINHPNVALAFGAYHLADEPRLFDRIPEIVRRVAIVTLADRDQTPRHENDALLPGDGRLPLAEIISAFEESGYSGWYELEVWSQDLWKLDHRDLMRRCLDARDQLTAQFASR